MKILHIWDICNNSALISEKLNEKGHKSFVITRKNYSQKELLKYLINVIYHLLTFKANIIHINAWDKGVLFAKLLSPKSKIIMHYHGSDIRFKQIPILIQLFSKRICVSTMDLLDIDSIVPIDLLPVLVSKDFYYRGGREKGTILELDQEKRLIEYELMPFILSLFEYYRDKKRISITNSQLLSKTGMEAIKCGTKVITDSGEIVESFPMGHIRNYGVIYNAVCGIYSNT